MTVADDTSLAVAARNGDEAALNELVRRCLPVVYSLVRRRLPGPDADDVVQETFLRAVRHVGSLREPERFRSWVLSIAAHEVNRRRTARGVQFDVLTDEDIAEVPDSFDQEQRSVARLALAEQRQETTQATRWLEPDDQDLLSLWWLELIGEIDRAQLVSTLGSTSTRAKVRLQRLREHLDAARVIVRVLARRDSKHACPELRAILGGWDGARTTVWRKRFNRHISQCPRCQQAQHGLVPAERLIAAAPLLVVPVSAHVITTAAATAPAAASWVGGAANAARIGHAFAAKPAVLVLVPSVVVATAIAAVTINLPHHPPSLAAPAVTATATATAGAAPATAASPSASASVPVGNGIVFHPAPGTGTGVTYHVSPQGNDANPGTAARPFRSVNKATTSPALRPGDTVTVAAGTYVEKVQLKGSGNATQGHITLRGEPGAVVRDPSPDGPNSWIEGGTVAATGVGFWLIEGMQVEQSEWGAIVLAGTHDMIVANNHVNDAGASGIIALPAGYYGGGEQEVQSHNITVVGNTLQRSNRRYPGGDTNVGAQEALSIWGVDEFDVGGNRVLGCTREGIDIKTGSRRGRVHHNTVANCAVISGTAVGYHGGAAIYLDGSRSNAFDVEIDHNLVHDNVADAIVVADEEPAKGDVQRVRIHDNMVHDNGRLGVNGGAGVAISPNVSDVTIEHNTFFHNLQGFVFGSTAGGYAAAGYPPRGIVFRANLVANQTYRNGVLSPTGDPVSLIGTVVTTGLPKLYETDGAALTSVETGTRRVAKPGFVDPPTNLALSPGSAATSAGATGPAGAQSGDATAAPR